MLKRIDEIIAQVGACRGAGVRFGDADKKQTCRGLGTAMCKECGCICRMSRKAIDEVGCPTSACGGEIARKRAKARKAATKLSACQEHGYWVDPGSTVEFSGGRRFIKLAKERVRYTGINDHSVVEIGGTGWSHVLVFL